MAALLAGVASVLFVIVASKQHLLRRGTRSFALAVILTPLAIFGVQLFRNWSWLTSDEMAMPLKSAYATGGGVEWLHTLISLFLSITAAASLVEVAIGAGLALLLAIVIGV